MSEAADPARPQAGAGSGEPPDLEGIERALRARRDELEERIATLTRPPERGSGIQFGKRVGDGTVEAVSRLSEVAVVEGLCALRDRVRRALEKLAEGTYGTCDACGQPIPPARLRAAPESALCIDCASGSRARRRPR